MVEAEGTTLTSPYNAKTRRADIHDPLAPKGIVFGTSPDNRPAMVQPIADLKKELQGFFQDGLVVIVGSGLSAAEGIPGMALLQDWLQAEVPRKVSGADLESWKRIAEQLSSGRGLEAALLHSPPTESLEGVIVGLAVDLIEPVERRVIADVVSGRRTLPLSTFLPHANPQPNRALPVVTPNYDRLIEVSAEIIGWAADTMFAGQCIGSLNPVLSQLSLVKRIVGGREPRIERRPHIQVSKPHGSLDWFRGETGPLRTSIPVDLPRLIITPGKNKYRKGYDLPFDLHREHANKAIDGASRLLVLGYGFNDDHLETHLSERLRHGTPCLALTKSLSGNASTVIGRSPGMVAISEDPANLARGFTCTRATGAVTYDAGPLWQLAEFTSQILKP